MSKHRDEGAESVARLLRMHGLDARRMPELHRKTCDIVAKSGRSVYYIEVKDRVGPTDPGDYELRDGYSASAHKLIERGVEQLSSMPEVPGAVRLLWFCIREDSEDERLFVGLWHTLYGVARIQLKKGALAFEVDCFYFHHSPFRKWPLLDLCVIGTATGLVFCLNPESKRRIRHTRLFDLPKRVDGVIDPVLLERDKCCISAPAGLDQKTRMREILRRHHFEDLKISRKRTFLGIAKIQAIL